MTKRFHFSLQWPFAFVAGMMAGGQTVHSMAVNEPMPWSARGEATFYTIGCLAALAGMAIVAAAPSALRIRSPWRGPKNVRRMCVLLVAATIIGALSAGAAFLALAWTFFALPREIVDFITTP